MIRRSSSLDCRLERIALAVMLACLMILALLPSRADCRDEGDVDRVLVVNPGIWHTWFDEQPSEAITVAVFSWTVPSGPWIVAWKTRG